MTPADHSPGDQHVELELIWERFDAILAQIDRVPDLPDFFDPLDWDEHGLFR